MNEKNNRESLIKLLTKTGGSTTSNELAKLLKLIEKLTLHMSAVMKLEFYQLLVELIEAQMITCMKKLSKGI